jgi:branched-chain amino acid transport system permease protein
MGVLPGLKAFVAAVLGGIGNIPGAALGGVLLGMVETFVGAAGSRPTRRHRLRHPDSHPALPTGGLLGKRVVEKV